MVINVYLFAYLIPAVLAIILSIYGFRSKQNKIAVPFSLLMLALATWCFCHAMATASIDFETILLWRQLQYTGIVAVGPIWMLFALTYAGREAWATLPVRLVAVALALLTLVAVLTNGLHGLWWSSLKLDTTRPFGALDIVNGPLFWVHTLLTYSYLLTGIGLFIHRALDASQLYRRQIGVLVVAMVIPLVGNVALLSGVQFGVDDPTPLLLLFSASMLFYGLRQYHLLNLGPIAQRAVFESMPDGVIVLDTQHTVNEVNLSAWQFLPHSHNFSGKPISALVQNSPLATDVAHMLTNTHLPQTRRVRFQDDGTLHCVEIRLQPLFAGQDNRAGTLLVLRDMSEQVRAEVARDQRLREVSLLQQIARAANSALHTDDVLRLISRETLRALPWHRVVVGLLQPDNITLRLIGDHQATGESTLDGRFIDTQDFDLVIQIMRAGQPHVLQTSDPMLHDTATQAALQRMGMQTVLFLPLLDRNQQPIGMMFVGSLGEQTIPADELRMFETISKLVGDTIVRTQLYEAAQEASSLKSAFLATVSHELRTPLTSIIGYADMLGTDIFGQLPEPANEAVTSIKRGGHVLLHLINDILDFSKMESGHFIVELHPVDVALTTELVTNSLRPLFAARGLRLTIDMPSSLPLIQANSMRLEQVLRNLLANAIKFTEAGEITISASNADSRLRISIRDTGIGIPRDFQTMIFDAFRQVENPMTRQYGGTGLGLAITRRLIEVMGGTISVESEPGVGSVFHCEFHTSFQAASATDDNEQHTFAVYATPTG